MIRSRVNPFDEGFARMTEQLEARIVDGLDGAAVAAAAAAQAAASIDLEIEVVPAAGGADGYSSGIRSRKTGRASTARIAPFFDGGTLGKRRRKLKGRRKDSWQVHRGGSGYTAHRGAITAEKGISPQRFFVKARKAGRARLIEIIHRGIR